MLDLRLPDMSGFDLLDRIHGEPTLRDVPVVVFTGKDLSSDEETRLRAMAKSIVLKDVQSPERLLEKRRCSASRAGGPARGQAAMLQRLHSTNEDAARA